tara:strand:- start:1221 stop:1388 length:168 start_codon:yes stop_codon:yes gene_type:complete
MTNNNTTKENNMSNEQQQLKDTQQQLWALWHATEHIAGREAIITAITELSRQEEK